MDVKVLGYRIKETRLERGFSMHRLAEDSGVTAPTILRYENGEIANPRIPVIHAIARALGVNPSWLIQKSPEKYEKTATNASDGLSPKEKRVDLFSTLFFVLC